MKLISIVGARPQFIKAAAVSRAISDYNQNCKKPSLRIKDFIVHTGQHYDHNMSKIFFQELEIPEPDVNLAIGSGSHGLQTGQMLIEIERVLQSEEPDWVLVYGDTNSTLAGALAAVKLHIPLAHVEAGLRSFNKIMPEEHNRILTDHCSDLLFCPTDTAVKNLQNEGISKGIHKVGDVMFDSVLYNLELAAKRSKIIKGLKLKPKDYALVTIHRAENTDDIDRLGSIFTALEQIASDGLPIIVPLHPRTRKILNNSNILLKYATIIEPVSYLDMLMLEKEAKLIFTDSGGVQKEAYWMKVPCATLRDETEWIETVESGWNLLVGANSSQIVNSNISFSAPNGITDLFGDGKTAEKIVSILMPT
jgi:UDP-N-acetylglucosamine 2-epimerase